MTSMKTILEIASNSLRSAAYLKRQISSAAVNRLLTAALVSIMASPLFAQGSPWEVAVTNLRDIFVGPIARGLSLVSIVIGGLMFAFDEGGSKKMMAGILFGVGMAIGAVNFMAWLFP